MGNVAVSALACVPWRATRVARVVLFVAAVAVVLSGALAQPGTVLADDPEAGEARASGSTVTVRKGDRGRAVRRIQRRLGVPADGIFGRQTRSAVKRFQRRRGLEVDGIVGPMTQRAMRLPAFSQRSVRRPRGGGGSGSGGAGGAPSDGAPSNDEESGVKLPSDLVRIAECESGGDPTAVSADGRYRGKYQFLRETWEEWGGRGEDPAEASESHQDRVALRLYRARGADPWPTCGSE